MSSTSGRQWERTARAAAAWSALLALVAALLASFPVAASATPVAVAPWVAGDPTFKRPGARPADLGVVYQGTWNIMTPSQRAKVLDDLAQAGVGWVTLDLGWISLQPKARGQYSMGDVAEWDRQVTEITSRGLKILAIFQWAPQWASGTTNRNGRPKDPEAFAEAAAWVAKRYDGSSVSPALRIDAIQLGNEPNLSKFWDPQPASTKVSSFAKLVKAAGPAVKKANPRMTVVAAGLNSVDTGWYRTFLEEPGVIGTYDALGVHPYQSPGDAAPEAYDQKWGLYYMRHLATLDAMMTANDDHAKIWATEFGWSTHTNAPGLANWALGVSESAQADYLLRSMPVLTATPRVQAAFWYAAITTSSGDAQFDNYSLLRKDFTRKPAYYALKCVASAICDKPTLPTPPVPTPPDPTPPVPVPDPAPVPLVEAGSSWSYADNGRNPTRSWKTKSEKKLHWSHGQAQLGFGDGDEKTVLKSASRSKRPVTTYFRTTFDASTAAAAGDHLLLKALVDDGAVVYLNGKRIWKTNLPSGKITAKTRATRLVHGADENTWSSVALPAGGLKAGRNTLAVEVHQYGGRSSDLSFDLSLQLDR